MSDDTEMDAMMADGLLDTVRTASVSLFGVSHVYPCDDVKRMADEITRLRADLSAAREALKPFAEIADIYEIDAMSVGDLEVFIDVDDLRRARAALKGDGDA